MKVIVATDLTGLSERAVQRGVQLAGDLSAELVIRHVVDPTQAEETPERTVEAARQALAAEVELLARSAAARPTIDVAIGDPKVAMIAGRAEDLIVLGVHADTGRRRKRFAETTAGQALKASTGAILLVREPVAGSYERAVIGIDFSHNARAALHQGAAMAPTASIKLVHSYQVPFEGLIGGAHFADSVTVAEHTRLDAFLAEEIAQTGLDAGRMETIMREGDPAEVLRNVCREHDASLIVIGTHGRQGLSRAIWGSVAASLLEDPPCDVLVIRHA